MAQVSVVINGKTYRMACNDGEEEHLGSLAENLEQMIVRLRGEFGEIGDQRLTVMAAITMADQHAEAERRIGALEERIAEMERDRASAVEDRQADDAAVAQSVEAVAARIEALAQRLSETARRDNGG